jgi:hypothetical protein
MIGIWRLWARDGRAWPGSTPGFPYVSSGFIDDEAMSREVFT